MVYLELNWAELKAWIWVELISFFCFDKIGMNELCLTFLHQKYFSTQRLGWWMTSSSAVVIFVDGVVVFVAVVGVVVVVVVAVVVVCHRRSCRHRWELRGVILLKLNFEQHLIGNFWTFVALLVTIGILGVDLFCNISLSTELSAALNF